MAEELSDLPTDAIEHAMSMWRKGDTKHLSSFERDRTRIGVFFPKPAELRDIAKHYLRRKRIEEETRFFQEEMQRQEAHRKAHPEEYCRVDEIFEEAKQRGKLAATQKREEEKTKPAKCPHCSGPLLGSTTSITPADLRVLADALERSLGLCKKENDEVNDAIGIS